MWSFLNPFVQKVRIAEADPECGYCEGDGSYMHDVAGRVDCPMDCNTCFPQTQVNYSFRQIMMHLAHLLGMDKETAEQFTQEVCDNANKRLSVPLQRWKQAA